MQRPRLYTMADVVATNDAPAPQEHPPLPVSPQVAWPVLLIPCLVLAVVIATLGCSRRVREFANRVAFTH